MIERRKLKIINLQTKSKFNLMIGYKVISLIKQVQILYANI